MKWNQILFITFIIICCTYYIHKDIKEIRDDFKKETEKTDKIYKDLSDTLRYRIK